METIIRASSLSGYPDCPRRWAARHMKPALDMQGYRTNVLPTSIGAAVGSATHSTITHDLEARMNTGAPSNWTEAQDVGEAELLARIQNEGAFWDDVTPDLSDAKKTVRRLARIYRDVVAPTVKAVAVERRLLARHSTGLILSGQQDVVVDDEQSLLGLRDIKTGKRRGANFGQYGCYSRLLRSHGQPVTSIHEDYLARVKLDQDQPAPVTIPYDIRICERQMESTVARIAKDISAFRATGDPETFTANPSSALCSAKFCQAWGTTWCKLGRK